MVRGGAREGDECLVGVEGGGDGEKRCGSRRDGEGRGDSWMVRW